MIDTPEFQIPTDAFSRRMSCMDKLSRALDTLRTASIHSPDDMLIALGQTLAGLYEVGFAHGLDPSEVQQYAEYELRNRLSDRVLSQCQMSFLWGAL